MTSTKLEHEADMTDDSAELDLAEVIVYAIVFLAVAIFFATLFV